MTAELELFQTMIRQVSLGDRVTLTSRALPQELAGTVSSIGLEIGRQSIVDDDPAAKTDARVVNVIVELDGPSSDAAATFTNLEVIARIDADPSR
jgi:HlyD family secretion protein